MTARVPVTPPGLSAEQHRSSVQRLGCASTARRQGVAAPTRGRAR